MTEQQEQERLAQALDATRPALVWTATANGGRRAMSTGLALKRSGVKAGVPDLLIFTPTPLAPQGCAIELKRVYPTRGEPSPQQVDYIARLNAAGVRAAVAWGAEGARAQLAAWGYDIAPLPPLPIEPATPPEPKPKPKRAKTPRLKRAAPRSRHAPPA